MFGSPCPRLPYFGILGKFALWAPIHAGLCQSSSLELRHSMGGLSFDWNKSVSTIPFFQEVNREKGILLAVLAFSPFCIHKQVQQPSYLNCQWKYGSCLRLRKQSPFPLLLVLGVWSFGGRGGWSALPNTLSSKQVSFKRGDYLVWCYWFFSWNRKVQICPTQRGNSI